MNKRIVAVALLATLLATPAHAFRDTSIKDMVTVVGLDNNMLLGYVSGFRDAWAWAQVEIIRSQNGSKESEERLYVCAMTMSATEILRLSVLSNGDKPTTEALQDTLDKLCWSMVSS